MLVSAGETRRCNSHGNTGAPPLTAFPMIRNTADVDDRRRFTYDLHAVLWRSRPATLWSVANPPFNQRYIYQPFFENRSSIHSACRDLVTLLDYFLGKRHSPPGQSSSKTLMQNTVSIPTDKPKCLARVILSQNNLLLPPTQFDSNCKHRRHYFDSYLNLHFTWQTKIKQWNNSFNRGNFLLWIDFDWQDLDFLMEYLHYQHFITVYINILFSNFYFCVFFWYGEFSCIENCSKSPWKINGGNIKKRSVW